MYADQLEADVWTDVCAALRNPDNMIGDLVSFVKTGEGEIGAELNRLKRDVDRCRSEEARYLRLFGLDQIDQQLLLEQIGPIKALREEHGRRAASRSSRNSSVSASVLTKLCAPRGWSRRSGLGWEARDVGCLRRPDGRGEGQL